MDIKSKLKVDANFSMSSMTDIVFLLLIFFMLTASFITPSGLPVNLPSAAASSIVMQKNSVTITEDLRYYVNDKEVVLENLEQELRKVISGPDGSVTLHVDKRVASEFLIKIAGIAAKLQQKVTVVTKPE
ncbi:ExbD/TolR family protein [Roseivirga echinicomitans]